MDAEEEIQSVSVHKNQVNQMLYSHQHAVVISFDVAGMIEYWSPSTGSTLRLRLRFPSAGWLSIQKQADDRFVLDGQAKDLRALDIDFVE